MPDAKRPMVLALAVACVVAAGAHAEEPKEPEKQWSAGVDLTYNSKYVWRGINVTNDPVFQPSVTFAWKGLSLNVWGNMDLTNVNGNNDEFNELDFTLDYSGSVGKLGYSVGVIYYHFPNTPFPGTTELYGSLGLDVLLSPTLTVYADIDEADGFYATLSVGHTFEDVVKFSELASMGIEAGASVGFADGDHNAYYFGVDDSGPVDVTVGVSFPIAVGEHVTVTPALNYSNLLDDDLADGVGRDSNFWAGVTLGFSF